MTLATSPLSVLIVDDEAPARSRLRDLLGDLAETQPTRIAGMAGNGLEALSFLEHERVDVVLTDIKMPVMDGVAATRAIRALPGPAGALPILALTANADERDELDYIAAGMNGVAQKPIQPDVLLNAIRRVLTPADLEHAAA